MRIVTKSQTGAGSTDWIPMNIHANPFNVGFAVEVTGSATYDVEHTFDDILAGATAVVHKHETLVGQTTTQDGNYAFPVAGIRVTITAGAGSVALKVIQAGAC